MFAGTFVEAENQGKSASCRLNTVRLRRKQHSKNSENNENRDRAWPSQEGRVHLRRQPRPYHRSAVPVTASTGQPHHSAASG